MNCKASDSPSLPAVATHGKAIGTTWVLTVLLAAVAFRAAHFFAFRKAPYYDAFLVDSWKYDNHGRWIAEGDWFGHEVFFQDPLYAYFLGVVYWVFGHQPVAVYLLQGALGCATCLLAMVVADRAFAAHPGRRAIAILAGFACALSAPLVYYDLLLIKTSLASFLGVAHLAALLCIARVYEDDFPAVDKRSIAIALLAGALLGLNIANRAIYLPLSVMFMAWVLCRFGVRKRTIDGTHRRSPGILIAALYVLGASLVVAPITVRNYVIGGDWVLTTANAGVNLYIGNSASDASGTFDTPDEVRPTPPHERGDWHEFAQKKAGKSLTLAQADNYLIGEALNWVLTHPLDALGNYFQRWQLWLSGYEIADTYSFSFIREHYSPALWLPVANGYVIVAFGWSGMLLMLLMAWRSMGNESDAVHTNGSWARTANAWLPGLFVLTYTAAIMLFFVFSRYRIPVYPPLIIIGSVFAVTAWQWLQQRRWSALGVAALLLLVVGAQATRPVWQDNWWWFTRVIDGTQYYNAGMLLVEKRRSEEGLVFLQRAAGVLGSNHKPALLGIVQVYCDLNRERDAQEILKRLGERAECPTQ